MRPPNIPFTPGDRPRSTRSVENPLRARVRAAAEPAGPAPTTMASKRSTVPSSNVGKAGRVKGFPRNSQRTQGPQLELATSVALGSTRRFLAEDFALEEIPSEARDPSGQEMAHGFSRAPVGARQRAVGDRQDEATMLRVEQGHLQPSPPEERRYVHETSSVRQGQGRPRRQDRLQGIHPLLGTPFAGEIQDALRRPANRQLELPLDIHDRLRPDDERGHVRQAKDAGFRVGLQAAARNSLAPWGLRTERSAVKSIVEALRSRAGIGRNRSVDEMRRTAAMPTVSYRRFPPSCLP